MRVQVEIIGALVAPPGGVEPSQSLAEGATVAELLEALAYQPAHRRFIIASVDGQLRHHDSVLADGEKVVLSVTVGGG